MFSTLIRLRLLTLSAQSLLNSSFEAASAGITDPAICLLSLNLQVHVSIVSREGAWLFNEWAYATVLRVMRVLGTAAARTTRAVRVGWLMRLNYSAISTDTNDPGWC